MQDLLASDYYFVMLDQMMGFYQAVFTDGFVFALIALATGLILAVEFSKLAEKTIRKMGLDRIFEKTGVTSFFKKGGVKFSLSSFAGWIVKWAILLFFVIVSVDFLGLPQASNFLSSLLGYLPNLVGALAILTIGLIVSQMVYEALDGTSRTVGIRIYHLSAIAARTIIAVITFLVVLEQVGIQTTILQIFAAGFSLMLALAGGLAFGLGGQYYARDLLEEMKNKLRE